MLLGTGQIAAPIAHHQLEPISARDLVWATLAQSKFERLVRKCAGGKKVAPKKSTQAPQLQGAAEWREIAALLRQRCDALCCIYCFRGGPARGHANQHIG